MSRIFLGLGGEFLLKAFWSLLPALLPPEDLMDLSRRHYKQTTLFWGSRDLAEQGFLPHEQALVQKHCFSKGNALVLFCGGGRDAFALARLGHQVYALDFFEECLTQAQKTGKETGISVSFQVGNAQQIPFQNNSIQYVLVFSHMYASIPGRARRIQFLKEIQRVLKPGGKFLFDFFVNPLSRAEKKLFPLKKMVSWITFGNLELEKGDRMHGALEFFHFFPSLKEAEAECLEAGFVCRETATHQEVGWGVLQKENLT